MELEQSEKIRICYTNHALDDFLESLVDSDLPLTSIVRHDFGGYSTSCTLASQAAPEMKGFGPYVIGVGEGSWTICDRYG